MSNKVFITCAITGNAPFNPKHPCFPITPKEIADACVEAASAGAAAVHVHVRDPETGEGSFDLELFRRTVGLIRETGVNVVINLTAGGGGFFLPDPADESKALPESDILPADERTRHVQDLLPEIASLDISTGNQVEGPLEFVYLNTTRTLRKMAQTFKDMGVKPELEVFHPGDILFGNQMISEGLIEGRPMYQFVLDVLWGSPATPETVMYLKSLLPQGAEFTAMGIARNQFPMVAQSILTGGHVRVGLEDNLYLSRGVFATNGQLVERAVNLVEFLGREVGTADEMRDYYNLKRQGA